MATNKRAFTMRMQSENFEKIKQIAEYNKRSIAMQIEFLIEQCINDFSEKYPDVLASDHSQDNQ